MSRRLILSVAALMAGGALLGPVSGSATAQASPASVGSTGPVWLSVTTGTLHTCGIRLDHTLWCWGNNSSGRLGLGDERDRWVPTQVGVDANWASVAVSVDTGDSFTCGIRTDGTLWCWGDNRSGDLGIGKPPGDRYEPTQVGGARNWAKVALGDGHTCALRTNHTLWCWGSGGALGLGDGDVAHIHGCLVRFGHVVRCYVPVRVGTDSDWADLDAGMSHTCAIRLDLTLWCWGGNYQGALGTGDTTARYVPTQVATGNDWSHLALGQSVTCAVGTDLTLWCWGWNQFGELGQGDQEPRFLPTQVGTAANWTNVSENRGRTCATRSDGSLWCWGGATTRPHDASRFDDWTTADTGGGQVCGVRASATLWCWGWNYYGQLGLGDTEDRVDATKV